MNTLLISNPFLFRPSGDSEEEKQLLQTRTEKVKDYILYSFKEFEKAWHSTEEENIEGEKGNLFPLPISSPTISTSDPDVFDMDYDESMLMEDMRNFEFLEFDSPSFSQQSDDFAFEKEKNSQEGTPKDVGLFHTTLGQLEEVETSMFLPGAPKGGFQAPVKQDQPFSDSQPSLSQGSLMGEAWLNDTNLNEDGFNLLAITANDPDPPQTPTMTLNVTSVAQQHSMLAQAKEISLPVTPSVPVKTEQEFIANLPSTSRPSRQRRKSVQTSRNFEESPMFFNEEESLDLQLTVNTVEVQETKPLANLNGTGNRTRNVSAASTSTEVASSSNAIRDAAQRKKRKYECEDDNDPSVKNAKAAKLNRDKKKRMLQDLQMKNTKLADENQQLRMELQDFKNTSAVTEKQKNQEIERLGLLLTEEKSKNSANSIQRVKMLDYMITTISMMNPTPQIFISQRLADTPVPTAEEIDEIRRSSDSGLLKNTDDAYLNVKVGVGGRNPSIFFDSENRKQH